MNSKFFDILSAEFILPLDIVLDNLDLTDFVKLRVVSKAFCSKIDRFGLKFLCFSAFSREHIVGKRRWITNKFAQNFVHVTTSVLFFNALRGQLFSQLQHVRLCDVRLNDESRPVLVQALNSFQRLKNLDIIGLRFELLSLSTRYFSHRLELCLPALNHIYLEKLKGFYKLSLDAPKLKSVVFFKCYSLNLVIAHPDSVESLTIHNQHRVAFEFECLKNLKYLFIDRVNADSKLLSSLTQLREVHLNHLDSAQEFLKKKKRTDLKIFYWGVLVTDLGDSLLSMSCPQDKFVTSLETLLTTNSVRLANSIPFLSCFIYQPWEGLTLELMSNFLNRFSGVTTIQVNEPIQNVPRFLNLLEKLTHIERLEFVLFDQPQELFDQLSERSSVQDSLQCLNLFREPKNLNFLFSLKHLVSCKLLDITHHSRSIQFVRKVLTEFPVLIYFEFFHKSWHNSHTRRQTKRIVVLIKCDPQLKEFSVQIDHIPFITTSHVNTTIQYIFDMNYLNYIHD